MLYQFQLNAVLVARPMNIERFLIRKLLMLPLLLICLIFRSLGMILMIVTDGLKSLFKKETIKNERNTNETNKM